MQPCEPVTCNPGIKFGLAHFPVFSVRLSVTYLQLSDFIQRLGRLRSHLILGFELPAELMWQLISLLCNGANIYNLL